MNSTADRDAPSQNAAIKVRVSHHDLEQAQFRHPHVEKSYLRQWGWSPSESAWEQRRLVTVKPMARKPSDLSGLADAEGLKMLPAGCCISPIRCP
jgi:hypothetical protein